MDVSKLKSSQPLDCRITNIHLTSENGTTMYKSTQSAFKVVTPSSKNPDGK